MLTKEKIYEALISDGATEEEVKAKLDETFREAQKVLDEFKKTVYNNIDRLTAANRIKIVDEECNNLYEIKTYNA